jgi:hypothetical protein
VDRFILDLLLGSGHQISNSDFSVLGPVGLNVGQLEVEQLTVESGEEGQQEVLFTLEPEVTVCEIESPSPSGALSEHEEIFSAGNKSKDTKASQKDKRLTSGEAEMFVVGGDWFCASEF